MGARIGPDSCEGPASGVPLLTRPDVNRICVQGLTGPQARHRLPPSPRFLLRRVAGAGRCARVSSVPFGGAVQQLVLTGSCSSSPSSRTAPPAITRLTRWAVWRLPRRHPENRRVSLQLRGAPRSGEHAQDRLPWAGTDSHTNGARSLLTIHLAGIDSTATYREAKGVFPA